MRVTIHVRTSASRAAVGGEYDGALVVRVREAPERGRATDAALAAVARALGVPGRSVTLVRGSTSHRKVIDVDGGTGEGDEERLVEAIDTLRSGSRDRTKKRRRQGGGELGELDS